MSSMLGSKWSIPPIPWDREDVWPDSCPTVTNYLFDAFESAFGIRPVDVSYSRFPDGVSARLMINQRLSIRHNVWAVDVMSILRRAGLDLSVVVLSTVSPVEIEEENGEVEAMMNAFRESLRRNQVTQTWIPATIG